MRVLIPVLAMALSVSSLSAAAATFNNLYQVRQPVQSQQAEVRDAGLKQALDVQVLRLTGLPAALKTTAVKSLRDDPQVVIRQYGYEPDGQALLVDFDANALERKLREADLALWGANRPAVLTWWLSDAQSGSQLLGDGQSSAQLIKAAAQYRGVVARLPMADLSEQVGVTGEVIDAADQASLQALAERYSADVMMAVHAREGAEQWQADWYLWREQALEKGQVSATDQAALADAVMLAVTQTLAPHYVVAPGQSALMKVQIDGADLTRFAAVERVMEGFAGRLLSAKGGRLLYEVNASAEQLRGQLGLLQLQEGAPTLKAETETETETETGAPVVSEVVQPSDDRLYFHW